MTGAENPDPSRPADEILAEISSVLDGPRTPPEPITLGYALFVDVDQTWPCADWCCSRGCPGPGNSLCLTASREACPGWCTCGHQHIRDVVRTLQEEPSGDAFNATTLAWHRLLTGNCRRPRWLPPWGWLHCRSCTRSTPRAGAAPATLVPSAGADS